MWFGGLAFAKELIDDYCEESEWYHGLLEELWGQQFGPNRWLLSVRAFTIAADTLDSMNLGVVGTFENCQRLLVFGSDLVHEDVLVDEFKVEPCTVGVIKLINARS